MEVLGYLLARGLLGRGINQPEGVPAPESFTASMNQMQFIHVNINNFKAAGGQHHPHKDFVNFV